MAQVQDVVLRLRFEGDQAEAGLKQVEGQLNKLGVKFSNATKPIKNSSGIAGAAVTELGRTISDLPYGIGAITNNVSQLGNMFSLLVGSTGSFKGALKSLGSTLMGPVGLLVAFQAVVAAIEFFNQKQKKAKETAIEMSEATQREVRGLRDLQAAFEDVNTSEEERAEALSTSAELSKELKEGYKSQVLSAEEILKVAEAEVKARELTTDLKKKDKENEDAIKKLKEEREIIEDREEARQKRIDKLKRKGLNDEQISQELAQSTQRKRNNLEARRNNLRRQGLSEEEVLAETMDQEKKILRTIEEVNEDINKLRREANDIDKERKKQLEEIARIEKLSKQRLEAGSELRDEQLDFGEQQIQSEIETLAESGKLTIKHYSELRNQILNINKERLAKEKEEELRGITDPKTIELIKKKYAVKGRALSQEFAEQSQDEIEKFFTGKGFETKIVGTTFELSEKAKKEAEKIMEQLGVKSVEEQLKENIAASFGEDGVSIGLGVKADSLGTFGGDEEEISSEEMIELAMVSLNSFTDFLDADAERQIAIETNKTNAINEQLRNRLRNENLSAEEKKRIQAKIAANDAKLVQKQNEIEEKRFKINKAAALANALVSSYLAGADALARTKTADPFTRIAAMTMVITAGLLQVAAIAKQKFTAQTTGAGVSAGASGSQQSSQERRPSFNVVGASELNQVASAVAGQEKEPVRAYVVASDVSTAQELDRNILSEASIG